MQYLFSGGDRYTFMDNVTFEQISLSVDVLCEDSKFLKQGLNVVIVTHNDSAIAMKLPKKIQYKVISSPPAVKGDTASGNVTKQIELENSMKIQAPIFIKENDEIIVNTDTNQYVERAN
jgi:elongation factor P